MATKKKELLMPETFLDGVRKYADTLITARPLSEEFTLRAMNANLALQEMQLKHAESARVEAVERMDAEIKEIKSDIAYLKKEMAAVKPKAKRTKKKTTKPKAK